MTVASSVLTTTDINGGTIDGTTIGGASAAAGNFTTLGATGVATFSAGTVSAPAITTTGDTNTGIFFPAADTIAFTEGGVESMRITSVGDVGIGTSTPGNSLTVARTGTASVAIVSTSSSSSEIVQQGATTNVARHVFSAGGQTAYTNSFDISQSTGGTASLQNRANAPITFLTNDAERVRITSAGDVGIGTSSPINKLTIEANAGSAVTNGITLNNGGGGAGNGIALNFYGFGTAQPFTGRINSLDDGNFGYHMVFSNKTPGSGGAGALTERMRIDSSGNLLVGTTAATYSVSGRGLIEVNGSAESLLGFKIGGSTTNASYLYNTAPTFEINATGARALAFSNNSAERMRIASNGNLFIGTTTNPVSNADGIFNVLVSAGDAFNLKHTVNGNNMFNLWQTGTTTYAAISFNKGDTQVLVGSIAVSTTGTTYNTTSDYRLKENIAPMVGALDAVSALKPVTYTWKIDGSEGQGFIAHELAEVCPNAVYGEKDAINKDGSIKPQSIDTSLLVATLTAAIQEQQTLINNLTTRLNALEGK
jgi:hypothetical protein